ncbi:ATP-binding protein [Streptomyces sp. SCSIO 75703]|uniref:ATP-binding protein n=1 Tax=Streptomyces sp. SCSIO 75703 TaxID=3112165 RepID=UPI0004C03875|nr:MULTISPECIES: ATP-binding protein [unclassified Streptomyces]
MSSPAHRTLRSPGEPASGTGVAGRFGGPPHTVRPGAWPSPDHCAKHRPSAARPASAALRITCTREGFARARAFTRDTLRAWSLEHRGDDAVLVLTELATNAVAHAGPPAGSAGTPEVRLGLALDPGYLTLTVSDPGEDAPVFLPSDESALREHGRGLGIVDALSEVWGWTPRTPAGKTVWAKLPTRPLT